MQADSLPLAPSGKHYGDPRSDSAICLLWGLVKAVTHPVLRVSRPRVLSLSPGRLPPKAVEEYRGRHQESREPHSRLQLVSPSWGQGQNYSHPFTVRMTMHPTVPSSSGELITPLRLPISRESIRGSHRFPSGDQEGPPIRWETPLPAQAEAPRQVCMWAAQSQKAGTRPRFPPRPTRHSPFPSHTRASAPSRLFAATRGHSTGDSAEWPSRILRPAEPPRSSGLAPAQRRGPRCLPARSAPSACPGRCC